MFVPQQDKTDISAMSGTIIANKFLDIIQMIIVFIFLSVVVFPFVLELVNRIGGIING